MSGVLCVTCIAQITVAVWSGSEGFSLRFKDHEVVAGLA